MVKTPLPGTWDPLIAEAEDAKPKYWEFTLSWKAPGGEVFHFTLRVRAGLGKWLANQKYALKKRLSSTVDTLLGDE